MDLVKIAMFGLFVIAIDVNILKKRGKSRGSYKISLFEASELTSRHP